MARSTCIRGTRMNPLCIDCANRRGGVLSFFSIYVGSGPVSTVNPTSNKPCILLVVHRQTMQS